ncbi:MAG: hypothetical protein V4819_06620 [Verrucomicrobiota bacterium]
MKLLFVTSLVCALLSLLAVLGFSAMTIVPRPGAESLRGQMMLVAGVFLVGWLCLATWVRPHRRTASPPQWLIGLLIFVGIDYALGVFFFVVG